MVNRIGLLKYGLVGFLLLETVIWSHKLVEYILKNLPFSLSIVNDQILAGIWMFLLLCMLMGWCILLGYLSKIFWILLKVKLVQNTKLGENKK